MEPQNLWRYKITPVTTAQISQAVVAPFVPTHAYVLANNNLHQ